MYLARCFITKIFFSLPQFLFLPLSLIRFFVSTNDGVCRGYISLCLLFRSVSQKGSNRGWKQKAASFFCVPVAVRFISTTGTSSRLHIDLNVRFRMCYPTGRTCR